MNNFDYMGFGYGAGYIDYFVADAKKYTPENVLALCCLEYSHLFLQQFEGTHRNPVLNDIEQKYVAYRMGVDESWPKGCYTFVKKRFSWKFSSLCNKFKQTQERRKEK